MGIKGLTTFINRRTELFFEDYHLHDTNLVIDGNSLCCQLYCWHCKQKCNDCFGGDYDNYAAVVRNFFQLLLDCNVVPFLVFDGGYEKRKLHTILSRMKNRIECAKNLNSVSEGHYSVFPLFLRETFINVIDELGLKRARCEFEGDSEVACLAKALNCPILSYDSDYFIFDALYIPFSTFTMSLSRSRDKTYNYIYCQVYKIDKFLDHFGGMDKTNLPILAVLLGNDYIKRSMFSEFYKHLKVEKTNRKDNEEQRNIKSVITWLKNETQESAIRKILSRYKLDKRKIIAENIENAIKGYNVQNSVFLKYFKLDMDKYAIDNIKDIKIDFENIEENIDEEIKDSESDEDTISGIYDEDLMKNLPEIFFEKYRDCTLPPSFMDIVVQHKYYCIAMIEDYSLKPAHFISFPIVSAIYKIISNNPKEKLTVIARCESTYKNYEVPLHERPLPSFMDIQTMDEISRKHLMLEILNIDKSFIDNCLNHFPPSWHVLLIALKYIYANTKTYTLYCNSLILCAIILNYFDPKIGYYRLTSAFDNKYGKTVKHLKAKLHDFDSITSGLDSISKDEAILCMDGIINHFQMNQKLRESQRSYNRHTIHDLAGMQSCILHLVYLNLLLNCPYESFMIHKFYDGTFMYNISENFKRRSNLDEYMKTLLQKCPNVLKSFELIQENFKNIVFTNESSAPQAKKKRKRTKKEAEEASSSAEVVQEAEEMQLFDPNNKFTVLSSIE
ncbi:unnamed protein product [Brassicogethes aeneus]|uniref:XPG N-terminal domain-containing protein n=1 Tax=Brassicogethes aeneus TaxID=1431903 RepID=A0A9P0FI99_BRAAE|nr:unnamed protein product [Brassicogethes aeneus]